MIIKTGRFGDLTVEESEIIHFPFGVLGFPECHQYCLVDPGDDTLILWLQSVERPELAFPVLEPKIFRGDYRVNLSATEYRELKLEHINQSTVFCVLTIPDDIAQMTANLKAPIVINLRDQIAKQVVLQENQYSIKHLMFKELRTHLMTIEAQQRSGSVVESGPIKVQDLPPSPMVKSLPLN